MRAEPAWGPLAVVEAMRTVPAERVVFGHAKIVHVMEGRSRIETAAGSCDLVAGQTMVLGGGVGCSARPAPSIRMWTIYTDEEFLRSMMTWTLPDADRVLPGLHPRDWDGRALLLDSGLDVLARIEPLLRQMSLIAGHGVSEVSASRMITLFAQAVEVFVPTVLIDTTADDRVGAEAPVVARVAQPPLRDEVAEAVELLRAGLAQNWTVGRLAGMVSLSVSQLSRSFRAQVGMAPMRFLIEIRVTEFARLVEETDLPIGVAARRVGWSDSRVAASWLRRRYGLAPSEYRRQTRPPCPPEQAPCGLCRGPCKWRPAA